MTRAPNDSSAALIFFSYAREDKCAVDQLYRRFKDHGLCPWMDHPPSPFQLDGIGVGEEWDTVLRQRIESSSLGLAFMSSKSVIKEGYFQRELRLLLNRQMDQPVGKPYLISVLLDDCTPPDMKVDTFRIRDLEWYPLFQQGVGDLISSVKRLTASVPDSQLRTSTDAEIAASNSQIAFLKSQVGGHEIRYRELIEYYEKRLDSLDADRQSYLDESFDAVRHSSRVHRLK